MNTYYFELSYLKGYIKEERESKARLYLYNKFDFPLINKMELRNDHEMTSDYEEIIIPTKAQVFANFISKCIIKSKEYFKEVKEGW